MQNQSRDYLIKIVLSVIEIKSQMNQKGKNVNLKWKLLLDDGRACHVRPSVATGASCRRRRRWRGQERLAVLNSCGSCLMAQPI